MCHLTLPQSICAFACCLPTLGEVSTPWSLLILFKLICPLFLWNLVWLFTKPPCLPSSFFYLSFLQAILLSSRHSLLFSPPYPCSVCSLLLWGLQPLEAFPLLIPPYPLTLCAICTWHCSQWLHIHPGAFPFPEYSFIFIFWFFFSSQIFHTLFHGMCR